MSERAVGNPDIYGDWPCAVTAYIEECQERLCLMIYSKPDAYGDWPCDVTPCIKE